MITLGLEGKKWEIFKSAVDLFSKKGYDNTSMRDLADAVGIKSASLYNYFPSKESILNTMYQFYLENVETTAPNLEDILLRIPEMSPREVLIKTMTFYPEELQPFMDKIYLTSILRSSYDSKASDLVWKHNFNQVEKYFRAILQRMIDLGKIEPLDIDSFINVFTSFGFTAIFKQCTDMPLGMENWIKGLDFLFATVKEKD